jgi:alkylation response protein AidB-like acyl-CoA dehydrogenase
MFNLQLSAEQIEFRDTVRNFAANEIKAASILPARLEPFEKPLMRDLLNAVSELGLRTLTISEENDGVGADTLTSCIVLEELAAGDIDIAVALGQTALVGQLLFNRWLTPSQQKKFLAPFLEDEECHLAYAGQDTTALTGWCYYEDLHEEAGNQPNAVLKGGSWVIDGTVDFVANAPIAKLIVVQVKSGDDLKHILVPCDAPGLKVHEPMGPFGDGTVQWHHGCGAQVDFVNCNVPADNEVVIPEGNFDYSILGELQGASVNLGIGQAAYDTAVDYAKIRRQGGRFIVEHQAIGDMIARMAIKLELARTMIWKAAWVKDHPEAIADHSVSSIPLHTVASVYTAEAIHEVTLIAADCFGAMGVMRDMPLQKYVNDGFIMAHSEMSDIAAKLKIAETIVEFQRARAA